MKYLLIPLRERRVMCVWYLLIGLAARWVDTYSAALFSDVIDALGAGTLTVARGCFYALMLATQIVLYYVEEAPDATLKKGFEWRLRLMAMEKARRADYLSCAQLGTGTLLTRMENGAAAGRDMLMFYFQCVRELIPGALFSLIFIYGQHRGVFFGVLAGYALVFLVTRLLLSRLERIKEGVLTGEEELGRLSVRALTELIPLRLCGLYPGMLKAARQHADSVTRGVAKMRMTHEGFFAGFALLTTAANAAILIAAVVTGELSVGAVAALLLLVDKAYQPVAVFNVCYVSYKLDRAAFARYAQFLSLPDEPRMDSGMPLKDASGDIAFTDVTLSLGGRTVVQNVDATFAGGRFTMLCGESGSGKSTLLRLIAGLERPDTGAITLGGQSLLEVYLPSLYAHMAYVTQEAPVLDGTVRENLVFDARDRDAQALDALAAVGLDTWLQKLPEGLDTAVGERGYALSGGERQRLCLARVLLSGASLILLDEATSALDAISEAQVMRTLQTRLAGRTVLFCAHRLRAAQDADRIVVMQDGCIAEEGSFDALMAKDGAFAARWRARENGDAA